MTLYLNQVSAIVWKDFVTEFKTRELFSSMFIFAVLVILIFIFSINLSIVKAQKVGPGVLWVAFIFAGTIGLNRSFMLEKENDCIQGLMLTPADRTTIYFGKLISNLIFLLIMEAFILPLFMLFFNVDLLSNLGPILLVIFLGTLGFCAIGTLLSSLVVEFENTGDHVADPVVPFDGSRHHWCGADDRAIAGRRNFSVHDEMDWLDPVF